MLKSPLASGSLMRWGNKGKGSWITVFANGGHAYAMIVGLRWDTSAVNEPLQSGSGHPLAPDQALLLGLQDPPLPEVCEYYPARTSGLDDSASAAPGWPSESAKIVQGGLAPGMALR